MRGGLMAGLVGAALMGGDPVSSLPLFSLTLCLSLFLSLSPPSAHMRKSETTIRRQLPAVQKESSHDDRNQPAP